MHALFVHNTETWIVLLLYIVQIILMCTLCIHFITVLQEAHVAYAHTCTCNYYSAYTQGLN